MNPYPAGFFARLARAIARATGHPGTFGMAVLVIAAWVATGPIFHFSDTLSPRRIFPML